MRYNKSQDKSRLLVFHWRLQVPNARKKSCIVVCEIFTRFSVIRIDVCGALTRIHTHYFMVEH